MANEKRMDSVILGFLNHQPMSGYEIKKNIDTTLRFFWSGSYGSIYPTLAMLEKKGLVTRQSASDNKRDKNVYSITESGKQQLMIWLCDPSAKDEMKYETLLKLFFGGNLNREQTLERIAVFEKKIHDDLIFLEMCYNNLKNSEKTPDHLNYLLTVMFGIQTYKGYLNWCTEAKLLI